MNILNVIMVRPTNLELSDPRLVGKGSWKNREVREFYVGENSPTQRLCMKKNLEITFQLKTLRFHDLSNCQLDFPTTCMHYINF